MSLSCKQWPALYVVQMQKLGVLLLKLLGTLLKLNKCMSVGLDMSLLLPSFEGGWR